MNDNYEYHKSCFERGVMINEEWLRDHPDKGQPRLRYLLFQNHSASHYVATREEAVEYVAAAKDGPYPVTEVYDLTHEMEVQLTLEGVWNL